MSKLYDRLLYSVTSTPSATDIIDFKRIFLAEKYHKLSKDELSYLISLLSNNMNSFELLLWIFQLHDITRDHIQTAFQNILRSPLHSHRYKKFDNQYTEFYMVQWEYIQKFYNEYHHYINPISETTLVGILNEHYIYWIYKNFKVPEHIHIEMLNTLLFEWAQYVNTNKASFETSLSWVRSMELKPYRSLIVFLLRQEPTYIDEDTKKYINDIKQDAIYAECVSILRM